MSIHRLTRLTVGVPDVAATEAYYEEFGLAALGGGRFGTVDGGEQLRIVHADVRRAVEVGVGVDDPDDLDRIVANLAALEVTAERVGDELVAVEQFTGVRVRVSVADRIVQQAPEQAVYNGPGYTHRANQRAVALTRSEDYLKPRKLGHVVLGSTNQAASQDFFVKGLGFKISDLIKDAGGFLRCSTDHHNLLVVQAPGQLLHHTSWQLPDVDAVGQAALNMIEAEEGRDAWGLGRHYVGSNFFWYLKDPVGNFTEYYADMDVIDDDTSWYPQIWEGQESHYKWSPPRRMNMKPQDLAAAMVGAHS